MATTISTGTALIYAYKLRESDAQKFGLDPNEVRLAYQADEPFFPHQCDFGKFFMAHMLKDFRARGGEIRVIHDSKGLVLPLSEDKVQVSVSKELLREWELSDLLQ